jgi:myo-inositol-1(or 4)-monophosphatase
LPANETSALRAPLEAVMREAGALARKTAQGAFRHWTKGEDRSPVSEADIAVNDLLQQRLTDLVPGAGWFSEELEDAPDATHALTWIVDPIDGTRAFIAGRADWSISAGLVEDGRPLVAALYAPMSEEIFLAVRGGGATLNGAPIKANDGDGLRGVKIAGPKRYLDRLSNLAEGTLAQPKVHSLALRLARVAQGAFDAAFSAPGSHDWDLAAADLLVHEAGGALTDLTGRPLKYIGSQAAHGALVAAGQARHDAFLGLVRDRKAEFA